MKAAPKVCSCGLPMTTYGAKNRPICRPCHLARCQDWARKNPQAIRDAVKRYSLKPGRKRSSKEQRLAAFLKCVYGITLADYQSLNLKQAGVCAICKKPPAAGKRLAVDHDHTTNAVRGLLCNYCNTGIGFIEQTPNRLAVIQKYLKRKTSK